MMTDHLTLFSAYFQSFLFSFDPN